MSPVLQVEQWGPFDLVYGATPPFGQACDRPPGKRALSPQPSDPASPLHPKPSPPREGGKRTVSTLSKFGRGIAGLRKLSALREGRVAGSDACPVTQTGWGAGGGHAEPGPSEVTPLSPPRPAARASRARHTWAAPGWYLFQFHRVLQYARPGGTRPFFWMFVDNLVLTEDDRAVASRFLEVCAGSGARAWGLRGPRGSGAGRGGRQLRPRPPRPRPPAGARSSAPTNSATVKDPVWESAGSSPG